ncbi:ROK family protein [Corynebacterium flavescens]
MTVLDTNRSVHFSLPTSPVARVFHQIRASTADRTTLQRDLGLSQASVTRHVAALIDAGLVEESRPVQEDGTRAGRPRTLLNIDGRHQVVWAAHVGVQSSVLAVADLAGRVIRESYLPWDVRDVAAAETLAHISAELSKLGAGLPAPVNVGVAFSCHVDDAGIIDSPSYQWTGVDVADLLAFPVSVGTGVAAMASTEIIEKPFEPAESSSAPSSILYFYAREVVAHAWIFNGTVHRPNSGKTPSVFRGRLSNSATLKEAARRGLSVNSVRELAHLAHTNYNARAVLDERARGLGRAVTAAVDIVDPDSVVFAGEAFTTDPEGLRIVVRTLRERAGNVGQLRIQRADSHILRTAAIQVALNPVRQDPLAFA